MGEEEAGGGERVWAGGGSVSHLDTNVDSRVASLREMTTGGNVVHRHLLAAPVCVRVCACVCLHLGVSQIYIKLGLQASVCASVRDVAVPTFAVCCALCALALIAFTCLWTFHSRTLWTWSRRGWSGG